MDAQASKDQSAILVRLPRQTHDALKALADQEQRTMAGQLRYLIEQATGLREAAA
jgi:hypothetical protein